jgi:hypothetical protein
MRLTQYQPVAALETAGVSSLTHSPPLGGDAVRLTLTATVILNRSTVAGGAASMRLAGTGS